MYLDSPDPLSVFCQKLELTAEIYVDSAFCGNWAVDTSGSKRIPFHLISRGEAWVHFQNRDPFKLSANNLVIFPHDSSHIIANSSEIPAEDSINAEMKDDGGPVTNMICGFFEFKDKASLPIIDALAKVIILDSEMLGENSMIRSIINLIIIELDKRESGYYATINTLAYLLFIQIIRHQLKSNAVSSGLLAALFDPKIGHALNQIHSHPSKKWSIESLASEAAMGRTSFSQRFGELVGIPVMQYLSHWRMKEATQLLKYSDLSLLEIADKSGYDSESSFSKAYKKICGENPGIIRKQARTISRNQT